MNNLPVIAVAAASIATILGLVAITAGEYKLHSARPTSFDTPRQFKPTEVHTSSPLASVEVRCFGNKCNVTVGGFGHASACWDVTCDGEVVPGACSRMMAAGETDTYTIAGSVRSCQSSGITNLRIR